MSITRRIALITGGSSGIGAAFAERVAADGHDLVLVARDPERLAATAARLTATGATVSTLSADLASTAGVEAVIERARSGVDLLILNAGVTHAAAVGTTDPAEADAIVRLLATGVMQTCEAVVPMMIERAGDEITRDGVTREVIIVSSIAAFTPMRKSAIYAASKSFVTSYARSLDAEVRPQGVRVLAVCPGYVRTGLHERAGLGHLAERVPTWMWLEPEQVVDESMRALRRGRTVLVPGRVYRVTRPFLGFGALQRVWRSMTKRR